MRVIRIYQPGDYAPGDVIELSPGAGHHVGTVLRMQPGQSIVLFPGNNEEYSCIIASIDKKRVRVQVGSMQQLSRESPCLLHLAQAISKGDRMEFVVQKAVELGVNSITPLITERSVLRLDAERLTKKQAQWQAIAVAACEQSGRNIIPSILRPRSLEGYVSDCQATLKLVLSPNAKYTWRMHEILNDVAILIGPEGGLSDVELACATAHGFHPISLGPRILRTETAAIAALSVLQAVSGDL